MIIRRGVPAVVALVLVLGGCSDSEPTDSAGETPGAADKPEVTTVDVTLDDQPVELADAVLKCYDYEGHLMVEAHNAGDTDASNLLMDYHENNVTLSIGVRDGDLFRYEEGKSGRTAEVTRDGASVSGTGTIGVSLSDSDDPRPFSIDARCAEFFNTPPDSSKSDPSNPLVPSSCPPGQAVCIPDGN